MSRSGLKFALVLSLLLNFGVVGVVAYRVFEHGQWPPVFSTDRNKTGLPDYLALTAAQRQRWSELESGFMREINTEWQQIRSHREVMIREIFSEQPDRGRIEAKRAAIAQLQSEQQRRIIEQLLRERDMLDAEQRGKLVDMLLRQAPATTFEESLHGK
ncbi:MAG: periplasmic heavy metal sensor [Betaproteobacteria bacterium]|nr:periplasmic heavy metal sensor [Betaproteobacteria bacterium]